MFTFAMLYYGILRLKFNWQLLDLRGCLLRLDFSQKLGQNNGRILFSKFLGAAQRARLSRLLSSSLTTEQMAMPQQGSNCRPLYLNKKKKLWSFSNLESVFSSKQVWISRCRLRDILKCGLAALSSQVSCCVGTHTTWQHWGKTVLVMPDSCKHWAFKSAWGHCNTGGQGC